MNFDTINGQSGSSVVSPSSDSGVHSLDEQWECMSTVSGNSDSIQSIKTVYGGVVSEADSPPVLLRNMNTRGVVSSHRGTYGQHDSMSYLSTNGHNSDIAAMSDFSDEEDEPREEVGPYEDVQPNIRTDWVGEDTINSGEHLVLLATPMSWIFTMRIIGQIFAFWRNRHLSWTMLNWRQVVIRMQLRS